MRYLLVALILWPLLGQAAEPAAPTTPVKAVLVTGASTGIGRNLTEHLAAAGYFVYAGARKDADLEALGKIKNVQPLRLDVTKQADVDYFIKISYVEPSYFWNIATGHKRQNANNKKPGYAW